MIETQLITFACILHTISEFIFIIIVAVDARGGYGNKIARPE